MLTYVSVGHGQNVLLLVIAVILARYFMGELVQRSV